MEIAVDIHGELVMLCSSLSLCILKICIQLQSPDCSTNIWRFSCSLEASVLQCHQVCFHFTFSWCTNFPTSLKSKNLFAIVYFVDFHIFLMCIKSSEWKSIEWSVVCQVCEVNVGVWPPVAASSLLCSVWICEDSAAPSQTDDLTIKIKILHSSHFKWQNLRCVSKSYRFQESGRPRPPCQMKRN